jgi:hypothetical protein
VTSEEYKKEQEFVLEYFKSKIQEHVTYWLTFTVLLFTSEQMFLNPDIPKNLFGVPNIQAFFISVIFYVGATIYVIGRICYWESFTSILFSIYNIEDTDTRYSFKNKIIKFVNNLIINPTEEYSKNIRRRIGRLFIKVDTVICLLVGCFLLSIIYLVLSDYLTRIGIFV